MKPYQFSLLWAFLLVEKIHVQLSDQELFILNQNA